MDWNMETHWRNWLKKNPTYIKMQPEEKVKFNDNNSQYNNSINNTNTQTINEYNNTNTKIINKHNKKY